MKKSLLTILIAFMSLASFAQYDTRNQSELEKAMRSDGKIYVVVAVCLTILIGLILYLVRIDRKISKMEKTTNNI